MKEKGYPGIDIFRIVAALLVVAIHISPLASYNETGDFILTRVIARCAVPFFLMTSGLFLNPESPGLPAKRLSGYVRKMTELYLFAVVLYLPLNVYMGYFSMPDFWPNFLKDLFFDGTMYHLWYFPAAILGGILSWYLIRKAGMRRAILLAGVLYLIGLFGDSYYGISRELPLLRGLYGQIFRISDYTRNGIFYAPIFLVLGAAANRKRLPKKTTLWGFGVCFVLILAEALTLHSRNLQRHDSMYLFLPLCMVFLFQILLEKRGRRRKEWGTVAMVIYLVHPMAIVVLRAAARWTGLTGLLVTNSLGQYVSVCLLSAAIGVLTVRFLRPENDRSLREKRLEKRRKRG